MCVLSKLLQRSPDSATLETLTLGNGDTIQCEVNRAIWAREIDEVGGQSDEIAYYFATTSEGKIIRLTTDQLKRLTVRGKPTKTAALWRERG
jgi:hypothetical protein